MPGYEPLSEDANEVLKNESPLENAEPSTADKLSIPIHTEDPTFADQLQLDEEPEIGIFEPNDRRYLLYFCLSFVGFKSCVAWKTTKTYFSQDINSPGLRFIVTGLAVLFSRFVVMCIHWSVLGRFPVEFILPDAVSLPILYYEDYGKSKWRAIEAFSFLESLFELALLLQIFLLRRRFTMLAQKGLKVANDIWIDMCLVLCCQYCALAQTLRHMELRKSTEPRLQLQTV